MFDFPKTEHKNYKKNFLKTVIFKIDFDDNDIIFEKKNEITRIFGNMCPRINDRETKGLQILFSHDQTPILQSVENGNAGKIIEMKSNDGQKILILDKSSFSYTISGKAYTNYDNFRNELALLNDFYNLSNIKFLKRLAIRKINIVEFKISENPSDVLVHLISPELLSNLNYFPKSSLIKQNIQSVNYQDENYRLNLKYGLNIPPMQSNEIGQIILDIDLFNTSKIDATKTLPIADGINSEIFNIFNWAVSKNTIKLIDE